MNKLTRLVATSGATVALAIGLAVPAASAHRNPNFNFTNDSNNQRCVDNSCNHTTNIDRSKTYGPCSVVGNEIFQGNVNHTDQDQNNLGNGNAGGVLQDKTSNNGGDTSNSQSNSSSQSNSVTIAPNCSTTNITQAAAPAGGLGGGGLGAGAAAQVASTPSGGVGAGAGGAAKSSAGAVAGLTSSLGLLGLGLRVSKRAFEL